MSDPMMYIVEVDLPADDRAAHLDDFLGWYSYVHAADLYEAGFTACASYRSIDGEKDVVDVYQAAGWEVFQSRGFEAYRRAAPTDPYYPTFMKSVIPVRTPYVDAPRRSGVSDASAAPLARDWITIWRFAADDGLLADVAEWLDTGGEQVAAAEGAAFVRLLQRTREAPTGGSNRPRGALLFAGATEPSLALRTGELAPAFLKSSLAEGSRFTGFRLFPWPRDPALRARVDA